MGFIRPDSGIYNYDDGDPRYPMHDVLNLATDSMHQAQLQDRARLSVVEAGLADTVTVDLPWQEFGTVGSGITMDRMQVSVSNKVITVNAQFTTPASGSGVLFNIFSTYRPENESVGIALMSGGSASVAAARVRPGGEIDIWPSRGGANLVRLNATYPVNF